MKSMQLMKQKYKKFDKKTRKKTARGKAPDGSPNPVDIHVGRRMRLRRTLIGLSQEKLAEALGVTFQQVQKYERGYNRIGASRLWDICTILDIPVGYLFEDMDKETEKRSPRLIDTVNFSEEKVSPDFDLMDKKETLDLIRSYYGITNPEVAKIVRTLLRSLSKEERGEGEE